MNEANTKMLREIIEREGNQFHFLHNDMHCVGLRRNAGELIHWCGYVGLQEGHKLYGYPFLDKFSEDERSEELYLIMDDIDVHGRVTFADKSVRIDEIAGVTGYWWVGFDCNHCGDLSQLPMRSAKLFECEKYRYKSYVRNELVKLSCQLSSR